MHAALARLVNNEMTRKQEKIDPIPKRSSREAELSPRDAAPRLGRCSEPKIFMSGLAGCKTLANR